MSKRPILTTEAGAEVGDNQHSQTAGAAGPTLLQDHHLVEKLARFNRERIPERVVHAVGTGAFGHLEVTSAEVPRWTRMKLFAASGKRTPVYARFSTVAGSRGAPADGRSVNAARGHEGGAQNYGRDGAMRFDDNGGRAKNYEPNSHDGPAETGAPYDLAYDVSGSVGPRGLVGHAEDDDFVQAGALFRVMQEDGRGRLANNIAGGHAQVSRQDVIDRSIEHFREADAEYGRRVAEGVAARRKR
jgi:catalase